MNDKLLFENWRKFLAEKTPDPYTFSADDDGDKRVSRLDDPQYRAKKIEREAGYALTIGEAVRQADKSINSLRKRFRVKAVINTVGQAFGIGAGDEAGEAALGEGSLVTKIKALADTVTQITTGEKKWAKDEFKHFPLLDKFDFDFDLFGLFDPEDLAVFRKYYLDWMVKRVESLGNEAEDTPLAYLDDINKIFAEWILKQSSGKIIISPTTWGAQ